MQAAASPFRYSHAGYREWLEHSFLHLPLEPSPLYSVNHAQGCCILNIVHFLSQNRQTKLERSFLSSSRYDPSMHWGSFLGWHDTCFSEVTRATVVYTHSHDRQMARSRSRGSLDGTLNKIVHSLPYLAQATTDIQPLTSFGLGNGVLHRFSASRIYIQPLSFDLSTYVG